VREALRKAGRSDLIGNGPKCLVPSEHTQDNKKAAGTKTVSRNQKNNNGNSRDKFKSARQPQKKKRTK
jgi:hypothetical protein